MKTVGEFLSAGLNFFEGGCVNHTLLQPRNPESSVKITIKNNTPHSTGSIEPVYDGSFSVCFKSSEVDGRPIFTQAMADAGELPPVGSMCMSEYPEGVWNEVKYMGKGISGLHVLSYLNGSVDQLGSLIKFKPIDSRTDREKAIDAALDKIGMHRLAVGMGAQEVLNKLYDNGLLKC